MVEAYRKCVPQQKGRFKFNFDIAPKDNPGIAGSGGLIMDSECKALRIIKLQPSTLALGDQRQKNAHSL